MTSSNSVDHHPTTNSSAKRVVAMNTPDLGVDIWIEVAQFLSGDELRRLRGLNRVFAGLAGSVQYRHTELRPGIKPLRLWGLVELLKDPSSANQVRILSISPEFVYNALSEPPSKKPPQVDSTATTKVASLQIQKSEARASTPSSLLTPPTASSSQAQRRSPSPSRRLGSLSMLQFQAMKRWPPLRIRFPSPIENHHLPTAPVGAPPVIVDPEPGPAAPANLEKQASVSVLNPPRTPETRREALFNAIGGFHALREFRVDWTDGGDYDVNGNTQSPAGSGTGADELLLDIIPKLNKNISILGLDMPMKRMYHLIPSLSSDVFANITTLDVFPRVTRSCLANEEQISKTLVPFINSFGDNLRFLRIGAKGHLRATPIFNDLRVFPCLEELSILVPFGGNQHPDPQVIARLLSAHSGLRKLSIRHTPCCKGPLESIHIHECLQGVSLPMLTMLDLGLDFFLHGMEGKLFPVMQGPSETVRDLRFASKFLKLEEVQTALRLFLEKQKLERLTVAVMKLSKELVDFLQEAFPNLVSLVVMYKEAVGLESVGVAGGQNTFIKVISHERYSLWKLQDLSVHRWQVGLDKYEVAWDVMEALGERIPSVTSFLDQGNKDHPLPQRYLT